MNPDLFITIVFVSWVALFGIAGAFAARHERLREAETADAAEAKAAEPMSNNQDRPGQTHRVKPDR